LVGSELGACSIRYILVADVLADLVEFESDSRYRVAARPEMLAYEVPLLSAQPGDGNRALAFQKPDHRGHRMFLGYRDAHMHMVRHQVAFDNLALLLPGQSVEDRPQLTTRVPKDGFPAPLRLGHNMILAVPF
jgi:hypothetical protein